jgi:hypothetical protein
VATIPCPQENTAMFGDLCFASEAVGPTADNGCKECLHKRSRHAFINRRFAISLFLAVREVAGSAIHGSKPTIVATIAFVDYSTLSLSS